MQTLARTATPGITVPRSLTYLLSEDRPSKEWREAAIRDLIIKKKGEVLKGPDFNKVIGASEKSSQGWQLVSRLITRGRITRRRVKHSKAFTYVWHDAPLEVKPLPKQFKEDARNSSVAVIQRPQPVAPSMGRFERSLLNEAFLSWLDEVQDNSLVAGANSSRKFLESR